MNDQDRNKLKVNRTFIIKNLENVIDVVDRLLAFDIITEGMKEEIEAEKGKQSQIRKILDILPRRGPEAFKQFLHILSDTSNGFIANQLSPGFAPITGENLTASYGQSSSNDLDLDQLPTNWPNEKAVTEEIKVIYCNSDMRKKWNDQMVYEMRKKIRGKVLVINNKIFYGPLEEDKDEKKRVKLSQRFGTERDEMAVKSLFEQLHFYVEVLKDQKAQDIRDVLQKETEDPLHRGADCFVLIILTHGTNDGVYGVDGSVVSLEEIKTSLDGQHFPEMADKPKLLFIQACRGEDYDFGAVPSTKKDIDDLKSKLEKLELADKNTPDAQLEIKLPTKSHFLVAMASTLDSVSFRNTAYGSWFIQAIVYIFKKYACKEDILSMLSKVNLLVSRGRAYYGDKETLAVSEFQGTLLRQFYFFPGLYDESSSPITHPTS